jgi:curved DNA-binding protein CbpA
MPLKRTYYEILGVPRTATQDQLKKRYRQLVRKYHPDVAEDKVVARSAFLQISEAYKTLIDPDRRLIYDSELDTQIAGLTPRPSGPGSSRGYTGGYSRTTTSSSRRQSSRPRETPSVERLVREAEMAFIRGQLWAAMESAKQAAKLDPRNVRAHVILGDVYRMQDRMDEAVSMYTMALQLDPKNKDAMDKLDRAMRRSKKAQSASASDDRKQALKMGVGLISGSLATFMLLMLAWSPGEPIPWLKEHLQMVGTWSQMLVFTLLGIGALLGFLMSMTDSVRPLDDELVFQGVSAGRHLSYPIGLILILLNLFNFYAAAAIYTLAGIIQDAVSGSVMKAFVATVCVLAIVGVVYTPGTRQVLIWGGNLVFPALLVGWTIGDFIKPWG